MSNVRKTWKTLSAVPDPFEPGVVYVTQELTGHTVMVEQKEDAFQELREEWVALGHQPNEYTHDRYGAMELSSKPETRVQRCRLHANGRLENTDVAPDKINDTQKVQVVRGDGSGRWTALPAGMVISDDGTLLNWKGENYLRQGDVPEEHWPALDVSGNKTSEISVEAPWLSNEIPVPPVQALGLLHLWSKTPGARVAVVGYGDKQGIRTNFLRLLKYCTLRPVNLKLFGTGPIELQGPDEAEKPLRLDFYGTDRPEQLRGQQAHYFMVEERVVQDNALPQDASGLDVLDNLRLSARLGDNPDGIVLDKF